jgi:hypothetical protein
MMYGHDFSDRFPPRFVSETNGEVKEASPALGGNDPRTDNLPCAPTALQRPLYSYLRPSRVFHCTEDKGIRSTPCSGSVGFFEPTAWEAVGCSYLYNTPFAYWMTRNVMEDPVNGIAGKTTGWVLSPSLYILMSEFPARSFYPSGGTAMFVHWHYSGGSYDSVSIPLSDVPKDGRKFISTTLFTDGHVASHDFSRNIQANPSYPFEPTRDWVWYKPKPPTN